LFDGWCKILFIISIGLQIFEALFSWCVIFILFFFGGVGQMWLCFFWDLWDALLILNFLGNFLQSFNDQLWQVFVMLSSATGFEGPD